MFNEAELQILISGSPSGIDVEDLKHNTTYTVSSEPGQPASERALARGLWQARHCCLPTRT